MSGRYERVGGRDDDEIAAPAAVQRQMQSTPNSPPPSFHSRASSIERPDRVDTALADAFESDENDTDDEANDRQRLVRGNTLTSSYNTSTTSPNNHAPTEVPINRNGYQPVGQPALSTPLRVLGGGSQADGVFSNMSARPDLANSEKEELPPTYEQAAADQAPPYWETTILAPGMGGPDDVYIEGLPVGSFFSFLWNALVSWSFQIVGFLLTYLLHSTHAAKNGSRAGLGVTLIQFGFSMKTISSPDAPPQMNGPDGYANPPDPNSHDFDPKEVANGGDDGEGSNDISESEWFAYVLMVVGWFILIRAVSDFIHARRHEQLVLQSPDRGLGVPVVAEGEPAERAV